MRQLGQIIFLSTISLPLSATILPKNDLKIPVGANFTGGLTFSQFHRAIDKIEKIYSPVVRSQGGVLVILRKWDDPTVNAGTYREDTSSNWYVNLYGGYARHPLLTPDGFSLVVCHEIGHHIGGAPKKDVNYGNPWWSSTEGQADYFATLKCLRRVFSDENNIQVVASMDVPNSIRSQCKMSFEQDWEAAICMRTSMAGLSVANVAANTLRVPEVNFNTPDPNIAEYTYNQHPTPQCRLDTYLRGSLCQIPSSKPVSQVDASVGTCDLLMGYDIGTRPLCWYKP